VQPCVIAMEAGPGAHHRCRQFVRFDHTGRRTRLTNGSPACVLPFSRVCRLRHSPPCATASMTCCRFLSKQLMVASARRRSSLFSGGFCNPTRSRAPETIAG
jgi:hypothetical protein